MPRLPDRPRISICAPHCGWSRERQSEPRGSSVNPSVSHRAILYLKLRVAVHAPVQIQPPAPKASHPTSHINVDKFFNVSGPFIQGLALFVRVLMPLVNADNSTFATGDMIQHRLYEEQTNIKWAPQTLCPRLLRP
jgi:hypothetical protein